MSTKPNNGGPAFPTETADMYIHGMSLRDWFAGQESLSDWDFGQSSPSRELCEALTGEKQPDSTDPLALFVWEAKWRAALKYLRADAMIEAKEKGTK